MPDKIFIFEYPDENGTDIRIEITEAEIMLRYYPYWMDKAKKAGKEALINKENCIDDFCVIYGAWEK